MTRIERCVIGGILVSLLLTMAGLAGCANSNTAASSDTPTTPPSSNPGVAISGNVAAPGGAVAFVRPTLWRMFARLVVPEANAASPGVASVGAGVTVQLVQLDNSGNVAATLATGTTDSTGSYSLTAPAGFTPGPSYAVQAVGTTTLSSFVTSTTVNVDPYTHATVSLITGSISQAGTPISGVSLADVAAVQQVVLQSSGNVSTASTTAAQLATDLKNQVRNTTESSNIVNSIANSGAISGTITDSTGAAVANVQILVRTFGDQTTMAMTRTNAAGVYSVHVPAGDYILGAMNDTTTSTAASQWWTSSGGTVAVFAAEKITVGTSTVTRNLQLPAGGRLTGTITGGTSSNPLTGIVASLCDYASGQTLMWVQTLPDGIFNFNVPPGTYYLTIRNSTLQPYGSSVVATQTSGALNKTQAAKIAITAGQALSGSMTLAQGNLISGNVYRDTNNTTPVPGMVVRFQDNSGNNPGAFAESMRTNVDGSYRIWVQPGSYNILTRGQSYTVNASAGDVTHTFNANVSTITGVLQDTGGKPLGQTFVYVYGCANSSSPCNTPSGMLGYEVSAGDGSFTVYADPATNPNGVVLATVVSDGRAIGSVVYPNTALSTPTYSNNNYPTNGKIIGGLVAGGSSSVGTLTLPAGAVLSGTVRVNGSAAGNQMVQVRYNNVGSATNGSYRLLNVRTMNDGSYTVSLPANSTVACVIAFASSGVGCGGSLSGQSPNNYAWQAQVAMGAPGSTTTLNLNY